MSSEYDRQQWQAEQAARQAALDKQREKERKARERSARNAQRKLDRLYRTLKDQGEISDFETEFSESVAERLDQYGAAFRDLEKGRPGDALSFAQKRVVAGMNRKVKDLRKKPESSDQGPEESQRDRPAQGWRRSSFKSKRPDYKPRIRQLDEGFDPDQTEPQPQLGPQPQTQPKSGKKPEAFIPERSEQGRPPVGKPFLRIVKG